MARLFGTDGVRGIANVELTCEMAYRLGQAAAIYLGKTIVVGRDTRCSGDMLGAALSAGIMSAGGTVLEAGIIPTPGVALLVREMRAAAARSSPPLTIRRSTTASSSSTPRVSLPDAVEDEIEAFIVNGGLEGEVAAAEEAAWSAAQAAAPDAPADATSYLASEIKMPAGAEVGRGHSAGKRLRHLSIMQPVPSRSRAFPSRACASLWIRATVLPRSRPRRLCDAWVPR